MTEPSTSRAPFVASIDASSADDRGHAWLRAAVAVAAIGWEANQFAPLLVMHQARSGLSAATIQATFGLYALGLIPGLLLGGPASDHHGRRRMMLQALIISAFADLLLIAGGFASGWLFAGRLISGIASGAAFSSGAVRTCHT